MSEENEVSEDTSKEVREKNPAKKDEKELKSFKDLFKKEKAYFASAVLVALLIGFGLGNLWGANTTGYVVSAPALSPEQAGQAGVDFLNKYLVKNGGISFVSAENEGQLIKVITSYKGNEIPVYMTTDGENIILDGVGLINMDDYAKKVETQQSTPPPSEGPDVPKSDKPVANIFVMSHCPYGLQMQKAAVPVMELLGDKADIRINFVHYMMHGRDELIDNNIEYCIQRDQKEKLTTYLRCFIESGDREKCKSDAGVNENTLNSCLDDLEKEFNVTGVFESSTSRFPPYPVDAQLAQMYGVRGSPTFVLNGKTISVSRSPESVKQAICSAFNTPPAECSSTQLISQAESPGFGPLGSGTASSSGSASCGG